ncbi:dUMP phosphatase [Photobacterium jeanii]|uniref:DUMP phosphatase n=1 Tax=Photobacterium jeanii TaxID=858640 RepID=A0A178K2J3_9GAMM|nr:pyrimidine 5'-nucleotidase [Photobacterium jeanii]OAN11528.1 dUMP phosphatase [Photobacterium jeanii]PST91046.1 dUMP phosphatase [Photobacterium jeanii]
MNFKWILFDADETLFHFDAFKGLELMFSRFDVNFTQDDFAEYQLVNKPLWVDYQDGKISAQTLQHTRFKSWAEKLDVTTQTLNSAFLNAMADICQPLPGAKELLDFLKDKVQLGIITNGFTELQQVRLERTGFADHFSTLVISEQVGVAKPDPAIFHHAFEQMGHPDKSDILMVGDNPHSDILGGNNAGISTCWLNAKQETVPDGVKPCYQVNSLSELHSLLAPHIK